VVAIRYRFLLWRAFFLIPLASIATVISFIDKQFQGSSESGVAWHKHCDLCGCDLS